MKASEVDELLLQLENAQWSLVENQLDVTPKKLERILQHVSKDPLFTFISGATTPCRKSVIAVSPSGRIRIYKIIEELRIDQQILAIVRSQNRINLFTIKKILPINIPHYIFLDILATLVEKWNLVTEDFYWDILYSVPLTTES